MSVEVKVIIFLSVLKLLLLITLDLMAKRLNERNRLYEEICEKEKKIWKL